MFMRIAMPVQRWSVWLHLGVASLVLGMVAVTALWIWQRAQASLRSAQYELVRVHTDIAALTGAPAQNPPTSFADHLPLLSITDALLRDVVAFAQNNGVQISSLTPSLASPSAKELGRLQVTIAANAEYKASKIWLAQLLSRYPALAVQSLALRAGGPNDALRQDIALSLVLYFKS